MKVKLPTLSVVQVMQLGKPDPKGLEIDFMTKYRLNCPKLWPKGGFGNLSGLELCMSYLYIR
jgi:hypothetical protein